MPYHSGGDWAGTVYEYANRYSQYKTGKPIEHHVFDGISAGACKYLGVGCPATAPRPHHPQMLSGSMQYPVAARGSVRAFPRGEPKRKKNKKKKSIKGTGGSKRRKR